MVPRYRILRHRTVAALPDAVELFDARARARDQLAVRRRTRAAIDVGAKESRH